MTANDSSSSGIAPTEAPIDLLASGRLPGLATAYLEGRDTDLLAPLRHVEPGTVPETADATIDRGPLARALAVANAAYGHPNARALADKLTDPATRVVVTGQQPGLFGGPFLTVSKALAAVRWAERLESEGHKAIAVFWVATEDHDWAEIARATVLGGQGPVRVDLGEDPAPLLPVGMRTLGGELNAALEQARALYPGDLAEEAWRRIGSWYRPEARFGEAFCRLLVDLMGERAPLLMDAMNAEVKQLERPHLRRLVERRHELVEDQKKANEAIEARGHRLQVRPQTDSSPLFLLQGESRRRIVWPSATTYALRGVEHSEAPIERLLATIDDNPAAVSPGVLARPAIQDALLGSALQVMGPAEISYLAQAAPSYRVLGIDGPATTLRPQLTLLEAKHAEQLRELGIGIEDVLGQPIDRLVAEQLGEDPVAPARTRIDEVLDELGKAVRDVDPTLERPVRKTVDQIGRALDALRGKVDAAVARRHDVWRKRLERIHGTLAPGGAPQERAVSVAHVAARYGPPAIRAVHDQLGLDPRVLHVVRLP